MTNQTRKRLNFRNVLLIATLSYVMLVPVACVCNQRQAHSVTGPWWWVRYVSIRAPGSGYWAHRAAAWRTPSGVSVVVKDDDLERWSAVFNDPSISAKAELMWFRFPSTRGMFFPDREDVAQRFIIDPIASFTPDEITLVRKAYAAEIRRVYGETATVAVPKPVTHIGVGHDHASQLLRRGLVINYGVVALAMGISTWFVLYAVPIFVAYNRRRLRAGARARGLCHRCGYDISATPDQCPECGEVLHEPRG